METFSAKSSQDVRPPLTAYTVNRLAPNTEWIFSVTASTAGGMGSRSATVIGKTLATSIVFALNRLVIADVAYRAFRSLFATS